MIFSNKETIKDLIIKELLIKNKNAEELQKDIKNKNNINISLFGLYKILRGLKKEEGSIIKVGKDYSISEEWKKKAVEALSSTNNNILLEDKEKLDFKFKSLLGLDYQWKNIILQLFRQNKGFPVFFQTPHQFWMMLNEEREKSEKEYIQSFNKNETYAFYSITGKTSLDTWFKNNFTSDYIKINTGEKIILKDINYLTVFNEYIIITTIPKNIAKDIEKYFSDIDNYELIKTKISSMNIESKKIKLSIERNKNKAKMLRKKLSKNFYIPKDLIEKYDLF
jgi:hypothetical protein